MWVDLAVEIEGVAQRGLLPLQFKILQCQRHRANTNRVAETGIKSRTLRRKERSVRILSRYPYERYIYFISLYYMPKMYPNI